eukprot:10599136-Ditylum_brightwellii.AAC.1
MQHAKCDMQCATSNVQHVKYKKQKAIGEKQQVMTILTINEEANQNLGVKTVSAGDVALIFYYYLGLASQKKIILSSSEVAFPGLKKP